MKQTFYQVQLAGDNRYLEIWETIKGHYWRLFDEGEEISGGPYKDWEWAAGKGICALINWRPPEHDVATPPVHLVILETCGYCGAITPDGQPWCCAEHQDLSRLTGYSPSIVPTIPPAATMRPGRGD